MDESVAVFFLQFNRACVSVVVNSRNQAYFSSVAAGGLHFRQRCTCRKAYKGFYAAVGCSERHALGVIAGRAGYDTAFALFFCQLRYFVICAAQFERACELEVLGFQVYVDAGIEARSRYDGCLAGNVFKDGRSIEYFADFEHHFSYIIVRCRKVIVFSVYLQS